VIAKRLEVEDSNPAIPEESAKFRPYSDISVPQIKIPLLKIMKRTVVWVIRDHGKDLLGKVAENQDY
jgi:hypothetical protein